MRKFSFFFFVRCSRFALFSLTRARVSIAQLLSSRFFNRHRCLSVRSARACARASSRITESLRLRVVCVRALIFDRVKTAAARVASALRLRVQTKIKLEQKKDAHGALNVA